MKTTNQTSLTRRSVLAGAAVATVAGAVARADALDPTLVQWRIWHRAYTEETALDARCSELYATIPDRLRGLIGVRMFWKGDDGTGYECHTPEQIDDIGGRRLLTPNGPVGFERTVEEYKAELAALRAEYKAVWDRLGLEEISDRIVAIGDVRLAAENAIDEIGGASPVAIAARLAIDLMYAENDGEQFRAKRIAAIVQDILPVLPAEMADGIAPLAARVRAGEA
jgi:hypothetical protein